jgi:hypothetical protein
MSSEEGREVVRDGKYSIGFWARGWYHLTNLVRLTNSAELGSLYDVLHRFFRLLRSLRQVTCIRIRGYGNDEAQRLLNYVQAVR